MKRCKTWYSELRLGAPLKNCRVRLTEGEVPVPFVAVICTEKGPAAAGGVPEITPVVELKAR